MTLLDLEFSLSQPPVTKEWKMDILKALEEVRIFYEKNKGKLLFSINGDTPKAILEDLLRPHIENSVFEGHQEHYRNVNQRFQTYFNKLLWGTIHHLGETPEDRTYNRLVNQFRRSRSVLRKVPLIAETIDLWYERTALYNSGYCPSIN